MALNLFFPLNPFSLKNKPEQLEATLKNKDYCVQLKKDGARGLLHINPLGDGKNKIFSRNSGVKDKNKPLEMTHNLPTICNFIFNDELAGTVLDCEIFHPNYTSAELAGVVNPNRVKEPESWEPEIELHVFDIPVLQDRYLDKETLTQRLDLLDNIFKHYFFPDNIYKVETFYDNKKEIVEGWLANNEEGGVLKNLDSLYYFSFKDKGKKVVNTWVKYKTECEEDFIILGFNDSEYFYTGDHKDTWQYWITPDLEMYQGNMRCMSNSAITEDYYKGWKVAIRYGAWVDTDKLGKHCEKYKVSFPVIAMNSNMSLIEIGTVSGLTFELKEDITKNPDKYINNVVKLIGMSQYKDTLALRHPIFKKENIRIDKNYEETIIEL